MRDILFFLKNGILSLLIVIISFVYDFMSYYGINIQQSLNQVTQMDSYAVQYFLLCFIFIFLVRLFLQVIQVVFSLKVRRIIAIILAFLCMMLPIPSLFQVMLCLSAISWIIK